MDEPEICLRAGRREIVEERATIDLDCHGERTRGGVGMDASEKPLRRVARR